MVHKVQLPRITWRALSAYSPHLYLSLALSCVLLLPQLSFGGPAPPAVTAISPSSGAAGTLVTITGVNFSNGFGVSRVVAVNFGTFSATFTFISDGQLTATVPIGFSGTVDVTVVVSNAPFANATSATSASDRFTLSAPVISTPALSPWSMIALVLLLACFGGFALRSKFA
jgi:IPT/TIG domain-containing protein/exosortase sorting signal-containing protein